METIIVEQTLEMNVFGFSGRAFNKDYTGTAFRLMDRMWKVVKSAELENEGVNIWYYGVDDEVFAGVQLKGEPPSHLGLEFKKINLQKHAYYKHVGPYDQIPAAGSKMKRELSENGYQVVMPYIEIYGHASPDAAKSETELLMALK